MKSYHCRVKYIYFETSAAAIEKQEKEKKRQHTHLNFEQTKKMELSLTYIKILWQNTCQQQGEVQQLGKENLISIAKIPTNTPLLHPPPKKKNWGGGGLNTALVQVDK